MLMGEYATNTAASILMANSNKQLGNGLIRLFGAKLVTAAGDQHGQCFAEVKIKSFTGSDMMITRLPAACARQRGVLLRLR